MTDEKVSLFSRLRRLQEQNRSDVPATIMQKAMSSFTLQTEPEPFTAEEVRVVLYPQDPFVGTPEVRQMPAHDIRPGLINSRVRIQDSGGAAAQPDADGNYFYWPGTPEFDQVNSFYYTTFTLRMYERYARRNIPWSFPLAHITVDPHAGNGSNAFYSEQERRLGFHSFQVNGEIVNAARSADVVSHEAAHAVLDGLRDLYNESFSLNAAAFHESFGDMSAMLVALHDDSLISRLLQWTGGNLRLDNFISALAEQLTDRVREQMRARKNTRGIYLRNALNNFTAVPFDQLPAHTPNPETELCRESHNYSRLFTGVFYDILVGVYEHLRKDMPDRVAIHRTRDIVGRLLVSAVELGPVGEFDYGDMAKAFLAADRLLNNGGYRAILTDVFEKRGILAAEAATIFLDDMAHLPDIRLPVAVNSALAASMFLNETIRPALGLAVEPELVPMSAYRNASGNAFLTYFSHQRIQLPGKMFRQFDGSGVDVFGGLALAFAPDGRLQSVFWRPINDEDLRQIRILMADLIQAGQIVDAGQTGELSPAEPLYVQAGTPQGLWLADGRDESRPKLVRYPVIFDRLPRHVSDFSAYVTMWRDKLRRSG